MAINHAVVVTGWGEEMVKGGRAMKYWILKNSFGEQWGEGGYFKLERGAHTLDREGFGTCGMYFESVYPVMDEKRGRRGVRAREHVQDQVLLAAGAAFPGDAADGSSARTRGIELGEARGASRRRCSRSGSPRGWRRRSPPSPSRESIGGAAEPTRRAPRSYPTDEPI